jgi:hypothetical protein
VPKFSQAFKLGKVQAELDFVDVVLEKDNPLFLDPFAISQHPDRWSHECHELLGAFFQAIVDHIRAGRKQEAIALLSRLREPNETRLGYSSDRPRGSGIGTMQAEEIYAALAGSTAVKTGFVSSLEECELMVEGIGRDRISDLTTNIIRAKLADYTRDQCALHNVPVQSVPVGNCFDPIATAWVARYAELPVWDDRQILLVPKAVARWDPAYDHQSYYRHQVLNLLQAEALSANTSLVQTLKNGKRVVYKKDIAAEFPLTKEFLYEFSRDHPDVLRDYREALEDAERDPARTKLDENNNDAAIAEALAAVLRATPAGNDHAAQYHSLMVGIVEFLFFPNLLYPRKEQEIHEGRKRIDIVAENGATGGTFYRLHDVRKIPCAYIPIECKNYKRDIANPELDQLMGRLSANRGRVGLLMCRTFDDKQLFVRRCTDTFSDGNGLILPIDDEWVLQALGEVEAGRRGDIEKRLAALVDSIFLA